MNVCLYGTYGSNSFNLCLVYHTGHNLYQIVEKKNQGRFIYLEQEYDIREIAVNLNLQLFFNLQSKKT